MQKVKYKELLEHLPQMNIEVKIYLHEAVFKVSQGEDIKAGIEGVHTKNLFLKDKKSRYFLVTLDAQAQVDLKKLHDRIGASGRFSFGSAEKLDEYLGLYPGSVSVFGLINDKDNNVTLILDEDLMQNELINCHPMTNEATTTIAREDLLEFIRSTYHEAMILPIIDK